MHIKSTFISPQLRNFPQMFSDNKGVILKHLKQEYWTYNLSQILNMIMLAQRALKEHYVIGAVEYEDVP